MKYILAFALCALSACKSTIPPEEPTPNRAYNVAADGSQSPISEKQARDIAKTIVKKKENWPENVLIRPNITQTVVYGARRTNNGGWKVTAHKCLVENDSGNCGYEPDKPAIIFIDRHGKVIGYFRQYTSD